MLLFGMTQELVVGVAEHLQQENFAKVTEPIPIRTLLQSSEMYNASLAYLTLLGGIVSVGIKLRGNFGTLQITNTKDEERTTQQIYTGVLKNSTEEYIADAVKTEDKLPNPLSLTLSLGLSSSVITIATPNQETLRKLQVFFAANDLVTEVTILSGQIEQVRFSTRSGGLTKEVVSDFKDNIFSSLRIAQNLAQTDPRLEKLSTLLRAAQAYKQGLKTRAPYSMLQAQEVRLRKCLMEANKAVQSSLGRIELESLVRSLGALDGAALPVRRFISIIIENSAYQAQLKEFAYSLSEGVPLASGSRPILSASLQYSIQPIGKNHEVIFTKRVITTSGGGENLERMWRKRVIKLTQDRYNVLALAESFQIPTSSALEHIVALLARGIDIAN